MKSLLLTDEKTLQVTDTATPEYGSQDVLVRVHSCGICGSDVHGFDGSSGRRIPPLIMGHEASGIIEAVGDAVERFSVGDRVTFDSTVYCGLCRYCQRGQVNLCDDRRVLGVSCGDYRRHGAFAEFVVVPARIVYSIPESLPLEHAAMIEAVSVAVHAVKHVSLSSESTVLVVGSGMIGLLIIQAVKQKGCRRIIAVDKMTERLSMAASMGATRVIDANQANVLDELKQELPDGVDVAFEVVGASATLHTAIQTTKKGGAVVMVGNLAPEVTIPLQSVVTREIRLLGTCASAGEYPECIQLMASGAIDVAPLVSQIAPLEDGPQWFDRLYEGQPGLMKVILQP